MSGYSPEALERPAELLRRAEGPEGGRSRAEMAHQAATGGASSEGRAPQAGAFALQTRRSLRHGETCYVTPAAGALLEAAAASVPDRPLAAEDVSAPEGCWFVRPLWLSGSTLDGAWALRAVSWASVRPRAGPGRGLVRTGPDGGHEPGICVTWYVAPPERPDGAVPMTWVFCAFGAGRQEALDGCEANGTRPGRPAPDRTRRIGCGRRSSSASCVRPPEDAP